jgi:Ion channel
LSSRESMPIGSQDLNRRTLPDSAVEMLRPRKGVLSAAELPRASMTNRIHSSDLPIPAGRRFFFLFLFLLATLLLYPYAEASRWGYYAFRVIGSAAIVISVYAAKIHRSLLVLALLLAIPTLLHRILLPKSVLSSFSIANMLLSFVFDVVIVVVIFRHVFSKDQPNSETIFGALCIYLLVGFSFASVYGMVAAFQANAFYLDPRINFHIVPDRFDFIYYSFGTMTSLGAAGIIPVSSQARSVSILEAILGVLYLAVLITRLMGAYRASPKN